MTNQVSELLTGYGPVHCLWLDGEWDHGRRSGFDWRLGDLYGLVHRLQPACLVGNNSHENLLDGVPDYIVKLDVEPLREPGGPAVEIGVVELGTADATSR